MLQFLAFEIAILKNQMKSMAENSHKWIGVKNQGKQ